MPLFDYLIKIWYVAGAFFITYFLVTIARLVLVRLRWWLYMETKSILDTIIDSTIREEAAMLDSEVVLYNLFSDLREKEASVLNQRFGLRKNGKTTLEAIGKSYGLTRERIRQIETTAVKKIRQHNDFSRMTAQLKHVANALLEEHGGIMQEDYLVDNLSHISLLARGDMNANKDVLRNHYQFILQKLLVDEFDQIKEDQHYNTLWKQRFVDIDHTHEIAQVLFDSFDQEQKVLATEEIISFLREHPVYEKHRERLEVSNNFDISRVIRQPRFNENFDLINEHKAVYSLLRASKKLEQNKFGYWGVVQWPEVTPKTINHKIYLVMKHHGKPLHFKEIASRINDIGFDRKNANPATVHNELILDEKYILIGRGIYALQEWGYSDGAVVDVVEYVMKEVDEPLSKDAIVELVLAKRMVKPATVNLALMNREKFIREAGKYRLAE